MKKSIALILVLILMSISGCSTIYQVAVDERKSTDIVSDKRITTAIRTYILEDKEMKGFHVSIYSYNENVFLVGEYENAADEEKAGKIARQVEGVKSVKTHLLVHQKPDDCAARDNLAINGKIAAQLIADTEIWSTNIDIKVIQCHVVLLGIVKSGAEITKAVDHAKSIKGVKSVTSYLTATK